MVTSRFSRGVLASRLSLLAVLALCGCASFTADGGFGSVERLTRERTGQAPLDERTAAQADAARARVAELLAQPLSADSAVAVALLNNRGLQAAFAELGIAEADLVQASRLPNPSFSFGRLSGPGSLEIDRGLLFDVLRVLTLPAARQAAQGGFEQAQLRAAAEAIGLARQARIAFFDAVAAQQLAGYRAQVVQSAEASNELAQRMVAAGNFSRLTQLREQSFLAEAMAERARARQRAVTARERLARLLALDGGPPAFLLPERLPDLPPEPAPANDVEQTAMDQRLDLLIARRDTEAAAGSLGLAQRFGIVNVLNAGYQNQSQFAAGTGQRNNGYAVEFELPLFDFGATRVARAKATYRQALQRGAQLAIEARSEVREAYAGYRSAYDLARHFRDEVVPLHKRISEENLLRYNGMLASVFELLADSREQIASVTAAVEALRDHWVAETTLQATLTGRAPVAATAPAGR